MIGILAQENFQSVWQNWIRLGYDIDFRRAVTVPSCYEAHLRLEC